MKSFPHQYCAKVEGKNTGNLTTLAKNLPEIVVAAPIQFDGPGDQWSPEELLMAAIANCLVLTFRAIAGASKLEWHSISCETKGELDKIKRKVQFTRVLSKVNLVIAATANKDQAEKLVHKAEQACLITNSLACESHIESEITTGGE